MQRQSLIGGIGASIMDQGGNSNFQGYPGE